MVLARGPLRQRKNRPPYIQTAQPTDKQTDCANRLVSISVYLSGLDRDQNTARTVQGDKTQESIGRGGGTMQTIPKEKTTGRLFRSVPMHRHSNQNSQEFGNKDRVRGGQGEKGGGGLFFCLFQESQHVEITGQSLGNQKRGCL